MISCFTESEYWFFIIKFLLSNIIGGYIVFMFIQRFFNGSMNLTLSVQFIFSLGIATGLISLILYYSFLLFPNHNDLTYILITSLPFAFMFSTSLDYLGSYKKLGAEMKKWYVNNFKSLALKIALICTILFFSLCLLYLNYYVCSKTITEHDTLEYAVQGKVFYTDKAIQYNETRYDESSGFYYVGLHGFTFPLLASWERLLNGVTGFEADYYFRSVNMYFGFLIAFLLFFFLNRHSLFLSVITTLSLVISYGFFETFFKYHIDNTRIFYLIIAFIAFTECIRNTNLRSVIIYGVLLGFQVNSHSLGALIGVLELCVLFLFIQDIFLNKIKFSFLAFVIMLVFGGIHYVIDVTTGTGWLFQEIKFF